jgi:hypothetical protein
VWNRPQQETPLRQKFGTYKALHQPDQLDGPVKFGASAAKPALQDEGDQARDLVAGEDHRGETARDDREKEGSDDGAVRLSKYFLA